MNRDRTIVYLMLSVLLAGITVLVLQVFSAGPPGWQGMKKAVHMVDTTRRLPVKDIPLGRLGEFYNLVRLEARTRRVLQKDTLTRNDSIFLEEVNKRLNRILNEKD